MIYKKIQESQQSGRTFVVITIVDSCGSTPLKAGAKMLVYENGNTFETIGGGVLEHTAIQDALNMIKDGPEVKMQKYRLDSSGAAESLNAECGGQVSVFFEKHASPMEIIICGGGHVGLTLAHLCDTVLIRYRVADNRPEYSNHERFSNAAGCYCTEEYSDIFEHVPVSDRSYIVILTHGHIHDEIVLRQALKTNACYIGMIGSRKKVPHILKNLSEDGIDALSDNRLYSPIGLKLGNSTKEHIAVSILSEIISVETNSVQNHARLTKPG